MSRKFNRLFIGNLKKLKDHDILKNDFQDVGALLHWTYYPYDDFIYL